MEEKREPVKHSHNENEIPMDIVSGIEVKCSHEKAAAKRMKRVINWEEYRKVSVPSHRISPLKENWMRIFTPIVEQLNLQIRFNLKTRFVEIRTCETTTDIACIQKAVDFIRAFVYGFEVDDALALLRLDDLFIDTFTVQDVKPLKGDHVSRAIGRLAGRNGRTKFTIENATKTRVVIADSKIHILGSFQNIQIAKRAISNLILGSPPSKVYGQLHSVFDKLSVRI